MEVMNLVLFKSRSAGSLYPSLMGALSVQRG